MGKKNNIYLTKVFTFAAAHQYGNEKWSEEKNLEVFGKDARVHGHNYTLHVTVTGDVDPDTGFLVDLGHLKTIVKKYVVSVLDHSQFEKDIPSLRRFDHIDQQSFKFRINISKKEVPY